MTNEMERLWMEFSDRLRAFIAHRVANEADVDDILQEVYLRIHRRADSVQHPDRLVGWLFQVTRNAIIDHYRLSARRREVTAVYPAMHADEVFLYDDTKTSADQAQQELASCLRPMVNQLPAHYREAITLVELRGTTQREAAERLGLSVSGMKSRVQRGRRVLREMLQDCCEVHHDARGEIMEYQPREDSCASCTNGDGGYHGVGSGSG